MGEEVGWRFLVPWASLSASAPAFPLPLLAGLAWSAIAVYRSFTIREQTRRPGKSVWWTLALLLWALNASNQNIHAFEVLVEDYSRALFVSTFMAANRGIVSLCLLLSIQLAGLLVNAHSTVQPSGLLGVIGVISAVVAVILGYLLSVSVTAGPLLEFSTIALRPRPRDP